jgi:hypothetical protein
LLGSDGIHPNDEGHQRLAAIVHRAIQEALWNGFLTESKDTGISDEPGNPGTATTRATRPTAPECPTGRLARRLVAGWMTESIPIVASPWGSRQPSAGLRV